MVIRQRAIQAEDKHERHEAILDAAERLLVRAPERVANVAEVADEAGLAKGTVYLYFPGKGELLLALHERHVDAFFRAVFALVEGPVPLSIDAMLEVTARHIVAPPTFLPLATRCFGIMGTDVPAPVAAAFHRRMAERLQRAGAGLERRFGELRPGDGVRLLQHSYALIIGLWQLAAAGATADAPADAACMLTQFDYPNELARALRALWEGTLRVDPARLGTAATAKVAR